MAHRLFVDNKVHNCSDGNPGARLRPFKSISAGVSALKSGDTLIIKGGIYRETVDISLKGKKSAPITICAAEGEHVVVTGADSIEKWRKAETDGRRPVWVAAPFPAWAGFAYNPAVGHERAAGPQLMFDSHQMSEAISLERLVPGSFFYDRTNGGALYFRPPASGTGSGTRQDARWWDSPVGLAGKNPNNHLVEASVRSCCIRADKCSYVIIKGIHTRYTCGHAQEGIVQLSGDHIILDECIAEFSHGSGVNVSGAGFVLSNNAIRYNGGSGGGGRLRNSLLENNVYTGNTRRGHSHGWEAGGIKLLQSNKVTVRGCRFIENDGAGLWFDWDNSEVIAERNFCCGNRGCGIMMEASPGYLSKKSGASAAVCPEYNKHEVSWIDNKKPGPSILRNNICVNTRFDGTWGFGIVLQMASNTHVVNNTVAGNSSYGIFLRYHPYDTFGHRCNDNVILNNIVANNGGCQIYIPPSPADKPSFVRNNISDFNLFWDDATWDLAKTTGEFPWASEAETYRRWGKTQFMGTYSAEEWFKIYGYDKHGVQGNPRFAAAVALDYRLCADSGAIGRGAVSKECTDDFFGRPRPKNRHPSIGAFEYFPEDNPAMQKAQVRRAIF
jgi:hypothetical protein